MLPTLLKKVHNSNKKKKNNKTLVMTAVTAHFGSEASEVQVLSVSCVCACTMCLRTCARLKKKLG